MNINEQIQQAYNAGRQQGLNEQGMVPYVPYPNFVGPIDPKQDIYGDDSYEDYPGPVAPDGYGPFPASPALTKDGRNVMYPSPGPGGSIVYPDGTVIYPDGTVQVGPNRYISPKSPRNPEPEDGPGPPP